MPYVLDGNNLIGHARGISRPSEEDRQALVVEISERLRATRATAVLVFDGPGQRRFSFGSLTIREAGPGGADELIVREVERSRSPREIVVVTADRDLSRRARDAGANVVSPGEFWRRFGVRRPQASGFRETARVDVEDWIKYFEDEKNRQE